MNKLLILLLSSLCTFTYAQINPDLNDLVINVTATVQDNPATIVLQWSNSTAQGTSFVVHKRLAGFPIWGTLATLNLTDSVYTDTQVSEGAEYEYRVTKISGSQVVSWGYISSGIKVLPDLINRGLILVLDTSITNQIPVKIDRFKRDLEADGYHVETIEVDRNDAVPDVKTKIVSVYNGSTVRFTSAISLGHVPVPYSGDLYPDAHDDHKGAWPTDLFYADMDGRWSDLTVNNTAGRSQRTKNIPGDGKYDQSTVPSELELEIGRIDFYDLGWFGETEQELMEKYLDKNHAFRNKQFVPGRKGLMDEGGFATRSSAEGFGQSAPRAMVPLVGRDSFILGDYFSTLTNESHLFSYGQGGGSYTSCGGVGTTRDYDTLEVQSVFTMLFGSYFGDYDTPNNLMRASLGSGTVLTCSWSSARPIWYYHHMAMGRPIGYSANESVNFDDDYYEINFGAQFPTNQGVHNVLLGDPTLRAFYVAPSLRLVAVPDADGKVTVNWASTTDPQLAGYNLYRTEAGVFAYTKVNDSLIAGTTFVDSLPSGNYRYMLRAVALETTASGTYWNESLGTMTDVSVRNTVHVDQAIDANIVRIFPNPVQNTLAIQSTIPVEGIAVLDMQGRKVAEFPPASRIELSQLPSGVFALRLETSRGVLVKLFVKE